MNKTNPILAPVPAGPTFWLPEQASVNALDTDNLFVFLLVLSAFFFFLIVALIVWFAIRYRRRSVDQATSPIAGSHALEISWSVIPSIICVVIFVWGFRGWMSTNIPPPDALEVRVLAKKWSWEFDYPLAGISGAGELVIPINKPIKLKMSSEDVIHSFFVPAFRLKRDVIPNRYSVLAFEANRLGTFDIYCTEYCGQGHSTMLSRVKVVSQSEFAKWVDSGGGMKSLSPVQLGEKLYVARGCVACHSQSKAREGKPGPAFGGQFGKERLFSDGTKAVMDDAYIRQSLKNPGGKIVQGYQPVMPTFAGRLKERELNGLVEWIKSLK